MADQKSPSIADLLQTPEAQAAIMAAAAEAATKAVAQLQNTGAPISAVADSDATSLMQTLAMHIAELTDQGTRRKRVAPEILVQREEARKRAEALIMECRKHLKDAAEVADKADAAALRKEWTPEYRVVSKIYFNEVFVEPFRRDPSTKQAVANEIMWTGMPNDALRPLNEIAKRIYKEYRASIGSVEKFNGLDNRPFAMTAAGLLVKTGTAQERLVVAAPKEPEDTLEVKHAGDPSTPFIQVLGTTAAGRARQNYLDKPAAA